MAYSSMIGASVKRKEDPRFITGAGAYVGDLKLPGIPLSILEEAGFKDASVEMTRTYSVEDAKAFLVNTGLDADRIAAEVAGRVGAGFVRATKPAVAD